MYRSVHSRQSWRTNVTTRAYKLPEVQVTDLEIWSFAEQSFVQAVIGFVSAPGSRKICIVYKAMSNVF